MLRSLFDVLFIFGLITFAYGDKRLIEQAEGGHNLSCTENEINFYELECKCVGNKASSSPSH